MRPKLTTDRCNRLLDGSVAPKSGADYFKIERPITHETPPAAAAEIGVTQLDKTYSILRQHMPTSLIVNSPLLSSRHAAYGSPPIE